MQDNIKKYIDKATDERKIQFERIQALIEAAEPEAELIYWYNLPTYRTAAGHICVAYWKGGVSLAFKNIEPIAAFKAKHPKVKTGKVSISFKATDEIPEADFKRLVKQAL
jgi:hypothetical protein